MCQKQTEELKLHFPNLLPCANPWACPYLGLLMLPLHQMQRGDSGEWGWLCIYESFQRLNLVRQRVSKEKFYWWLAISCVPLNAFKKSPWWAEASIVTSHRKWQEELSQPALRSYSGKLQRVPDEGVAVGMRYLSAAVLLTEKPSPVSDLEGSLFWPCWAHGQCVRYY